jgi:thiamine-monophosphate kinase
MTEGRLPSEFALIARYFAPLSKNEPGAFGLGDDAAALAPAPGAEFVFTKDALVEGVHFLPDDPAGAIARKLLRVNLSDLAAKGARPRAYLLATAFSPRIDESWLAAFTAGLDADQRRFDVTLIGGDTVATPGPLTLSCTAIGEVEAGTMVRRGGGRAGDPVYVSGTIGDAALGLDVLQGRAGGLDAAASDFAVGRYRLPEPRVTLGLALRGIATAAIDVSDGLVADLGHICEQSGLGAEIMAERLPLSPAGRMAQALNPSFLLKALGGGDDYEILFAVRPEKEDAAVLAAARAGVAITRIGRLTPGRAVRVVGADGLPLAVARPGYRHY